MKKFLLSIAAVLAIAFSANAKDVKDAPSAWGDGILDAAGIYNFNGSWQGSGTYLGDENTPYDASANDYAYIKVSSLTGGPIRFAVQYNKFVAEQSWGKEFQQEIVLMEADGIYGIKLDKNSKADGGKTFAEEIHQLVVQDNGKAGSLKIEEIGFCTEAEFKDMTTDPNAPVVGWVEKLTNVDCEADENSFFAVKENNGTIEYPKPVEGEGVDGGKCIKITSVKGAAQDWDTQFWIVAPEALPAGTKIKVSFDYKASANVSVDTQAHSNPGEYTYYEMCGAVNFKTEWQSFEKEVKISSAQAGTAGLKSIAFNLSKDKNNDVVFYIDNISLCVEEELPAQTVSFLDVQEGDIAADSITVRWTPNDEITSINIDLGFMIQMTKLMEDEVKAGVHTIKMLEPNTEYTIWLSKIVEGKEVKFAEKVYKTASEAAEISFLDVQEGDITAKTITVRWTPGADVTGIQLTGSSWIGLQGYSLSPEEIEKGVAVLGEKNLIIEPETEYTVALCKGTDVIVEKGYKTAAEAAQVSFLDVQEGDITAESITVRWTPNDEITTIAIKLDFATDMTQLMEDEVKAGVYTISTKLLKPDTEYTIWLSKLEDGKEIKFAEKVYKTAAETPAPSAGIVLFEGSEALGWGGTKCTVPSETIEEGATLKVTYETTTGEWWQYKVVSNTEGWPSIELGGAEFVNSNNCQPAYGWAACTRTDEFVLDAKQAAAIAAGLVVQGSINDGSLNLLKVEVIPAGATGIINVNAAAEEESFNLYGQKSNGNGIFVKGGKIYLKK